MHDYHPHSQRTEDRNNGNAPTLHLRSPPPPSSPINRTLPQRPISHQHPPHRLQSVGRQLRPPIAPRTGTLAEKPRRPSLARGLALARFRPLPVFDPVLERGRARELFGVDRVGDGRPDAAGLVRELGGEGGDGLGGQV